MFGRKENNENINNEDEVRVEGQGGKPGFLSKVPKVVKYIVGGAAVLAAAGIAFAAFSQFDRKESEEAVLTGEGLTYTEVGDVPELI